MVKLLKTVKLINLLYDVYFMCMSIMLYNIVLNKFLRNLKHLFRFNADGIILYDLLFLREYVNFYLSIPLQFTKMRIN